MTESVRPLTLAVYGFVGENAGSLASANFLVLRELLSQGHTIDFYAIEGFITRDQVPAHPACTYIPIGVPACKRVWRWIDRKGERLRGIISKLFSPISGLAHYRALARLLRARHQVAPYDSLLVLGLLSPWRVPGLRVVSWSQGTPNGEAGWLARHLSLLIRYGAGRLIPFIAVWYAWKFIEAALAIGNSDLIIAESRWSADSWVRFGVPRRKLVSLPYAIDLSLFVNAAPSLDKPAGEFEFLHLGRLVPRKRLDLLVEGFTLLRQNHPEARLSIVGGFAYAPGFRRLLEAPACPPGIEYRPTVPRSQVPELIARADCIVQTSENENFGSAIAEALTAGKPVLIGPSNGTQDYIPRSSVVFNAYTPAAVATGMAEVIRRVREDSVRLSSDARHAAERYFNSRIIADQLTQLLRDPQEMKSFTLVAADFVTTGGMDWANYALASFLARTGHRVRLVTHRASPDLAAMPGVTISSVRKPLGSYFLGRWTIRRAGLRAGEETLAAGGRVVVNGGNCPCPDANWVHYVHAAYRTETPASLKRRIKSWVERPLVLRDERESLRKARIVICNSERTRGDVIEGIGVQPDRAATVYYGIDSRRFRPATDGERTSLRAALNWAIDRPIVVFIGALGDRRKGFDTVFEAWSRLCKSPAWDGILVVVGRGAELPAWQARTQAAGLSESIRYLGFRSDVPDLLRAADALVAPTRYEAYGLGVHEALCCGLPALVSASAGVAERYPEDLADLLLPDPDDAADLAARLQHWRERITTTRERVAPLAVRLREYSWDDMSRKILEVLGEPAG